MKIYLVYCDFQQGSMAESAVSEILNTFPGIRFQPFAWMIKTSLSSREVYSKLYEWHSENDYIMITRLNEDNYCHLPDNVKRWIDRNIHAE